MSLLITTAKQATLKDVQNLILDGLFEVETVFSDLCQDIGKKRRERNTSDIDFIDLRIESIRDLVDAISCVGVKDKSPILKDAVDAQEAAQALANIFTSIADETCTQADMKPKIERNLEAFATAIDDLGLLDGAKL